MQERDLVEGCRRGDRAAQRALYDATSDRIYRLLLRMLRHESDAADVMQDAYIRAFERIAQFQEGSSLATWVYRIAVNEALQFIRRRGRRNESSIDSSDTHAERLADPTDDVLRVDLQDALERVPEWERTLLILRYQQGLNYAEMAELLEKPAGTIASGLNRARHMLRDVLEPRSLSAGEETDHPEHPT